MKARSNVMGVKRYKDLPSGISYKQVLYLYLCYEEWYTANRMKSTQRNISYGAAKTERNANIEHALQILVNKGYLETREIDEKDPIYIDCENDHFVETGTQYRCTELGKELCDNIHEYLDIVQDAHHVVSKELKRIIEKKPIEEIIEKEIEETTKSPKDMLNDFLQMKKDVEKTLGVKINVSIDSPLIQD